MWAAAACVDSPETIRANGVATEIASHRAVAAGYDARERAHAQAPAWRASRRILSLSGSIPGASTSSTWCSGTIPAISRLVPLSCAVWTARAVRLGPRCGAPGGPRTSGRRPSQIALMLHITTKRQRHRDWRYFKTSAVCLASARYAAVWTCSDNHLLRSGRLPAGLRR